MYSMYLRISPSGEHNAKRAKSDTLFKDWEPHKKPLPYPVAHKRVPPSPPAVPAGSFPGFVLARSAMGVSCRCVSRINCSFCSTYCCLETAGILFILYMYPLHTRKRWLQLNFSIVFKERPVFAELKCSQHISVIIFWNLLMWRIGTF